MLTEILQRCQCNCRVELCPPSRSIYWAVCDTGNSHEPYRQFSVKGPTWRPGTFALDQRSHLKNNEWYHDLNVGQDSFDGYQLVLGTVGQFLNGIDLGRFERNGQRGSQHRVVDVDENEGHKAPAGSYDAQVTNLPFVVATCTGVSNADNLTI
jgi:hypothetical protein